MTYERLVGGNVHQLIVRWVDMGWEISELWDKTVVRVARAAHWQRAEALIQQFQAG